MSDFEYQFPETYEEAVERKAYVLKLINEYNEALLLGNELPCSEEEIDRLQEEYQILDEHLALTEDGLKFPEINRFPDYPAVEKYAPATRDYLLYKLEGKKRLYGYDVTPNNTLVHLPKRPPRKQQ